MPNETNKSASAAPPPLKGDSVAVIADFVTDHIKPQIVTVEAPDGAKAPILILPNELTPHAAESWLAPYRPHPVRRAGTAHLQDVASLIAHVNRFKNANTALFADRNMSAPSITAVIDYHDAVNILEPSAPEETNPSKSRKAREQDAAATEPKPRFGQHRAHYQFPLSDEWKAWTAKNGQPFEQAEFAEFLEDRIGDVLAPPDLVNAEFDKEGPDAELQKFVALVGGRLASPSRLIELSRGLSIHVGEAVKVEHNLNTGEASLKYTETHSDEHGKPLNVPNMFLIAIPVFRAGPPYQIAVRLRYRTRGTSINWFYQLYRPEKVFEHAFDEACAFARNGTALPLFMGQPEK